MCGISFFSLKGNIFILAGSWLPLAYSNTSFKLSWTSLLILACNSIVNRQKVDNPLRHEPVISNRKTSATSNFGLGSVSLVLCVFCSPLCVLFFQECAFVFVSLLPTWNLVICLSFPLALIVNYSRQSALFSKDLQNRMCHILRQG